MACYRKLGIYRLENGEAAAIPGNHQEGNTIRMPDPDGDGMVQAECVDTHRLPRQMDRNELEDYIDTKSEQDSELKKQLDQAREHGGDDQ